jgi:hypothetical protein
MRSLSPSSSTTSHRAPATVVSLLDSVQGEGMIEAMIRAVPSSLAMVVLACMHCGGRQAGDSAAVDGTVDATGEAADAIDPADSEPAWTHEDLRKAYVGAHCDHLERCCRESERPYDDAACRARWSNVVDDLFPADAKFTIDTAMAKACVADWSRTTDHCGLSERFSGSPARRARDAA